MSAKAVRVTHCAEMKQCMRITYFYRPPEGIGHTPSREVVGTLVALWGVFEVAFNQLSGLNKGSVFTLYSLQKRFLVQNTMNDKKVISLVGGGGEEP